ncbi:MAG: hypothetical protein QM765_30470 [Myxococcales bacterium]
MNPGSLGEEIDEAEALFRGAESTVRLESGQEPAGTSADRAVFRRFARGAQSDLDLNADVRMAVPLYFDEGRRMHRLQIVVGIERSTLSFSFKERPKLRLLDRNGEDCTQQAKLGTLHVTFPLPRAIEVDARFIPTRERFRQICDGARSDEAIAEALSCEGSSR